MKPGSLFAIIVFSVVAVSHLLRVIFQVEVLVGGALMPMWLSVVGFLVTAGLAVALWREAGSQSPAERAA